MLGLDVSAPAVPAKVLECFRSHNYSYLNVRVGRYSAGYDTTATETIRNALSAGYKKVDGYIFLSPKTRASGKYVEDVLNQLSANKLLDSVYTIWMDVEPNIQNGSEASWFKETEKNIASVQEAVAAAAKTTHGGVRVGIYTSQHGWASLTNNYTGFSHLPLWWSKMGPASLTDGWQPFGGWTAPVLRQFNIDVASNPVRVCNRAVDENYGEGYVRDATR